MIASAWLALWATASAGTLNLTVHPQGDDAPRVVRAEVHPEARAPASTTGDVVVLGSDGQELARADVPAGRTFRTVPTPEGATGTWVPDAAVRLVLPWPDDAERVVWAGHELFLPSPRFREGSGEAVLVQGEGNTAQLLDLVVFGDGYLAEDEQAFAAHVDALVDHLNTVEPWASYISLYNVWRVFTPSADSGIKTGPDELTPDTVLSCHYDCGGIDRLICCDEPTLYELVDEHAPFADGALILTQSAAYGGSGGVDTSKPITYAATAALHPEAPQIATHELSHSVVQLYDEYTISADFPLPPWAPNCKVPDGGPLPWDHWVGNAPYPIPEDGVPGCTRTDAVRPTSSSCMMLTLKNIDGSAKDAYCPICGEHIILSMYEQTGGELITEASHPEDKTIRVREGEVVTVSAEAMGPPETLHYTWTVGKKVIAEDVTEVELNNCSLPNGDLTLTVQDTTSQVLDDPHNLLVDQMTWPLNVTPCGGGCACSNRPSVPAGWWLPLLLGAAITRRRRPLASPPR